ncbi:MAG: uncharacterized protein KVP18_001697 [Porospora cf. gigantea A]|uniref:uncharacterized protein n=1 Tax=Porospora cf. gigantea A TaxID=2853593 RepID=UPI00355939A0|nr:MAG: hypothetical protein KVP18_001697 [Porospora cf. gigantea A]
MKNPEEGSHHDPPVKILGKPALPGFPLNDVSRLKVAPVRRQDPESDDPTAQMKNPEEGSHHDPPVKILGKPILLGSPVKMPKLENVTAAPVKR